MPHSHSRRSSDSSFGSQEMSGMNGDIDKIRWHTNEETSVERSQRVTSPSLSDRRDPPQSPVTPTASSTAASAQPVKPTSSGTPPSVYKYNTSNSVSQTMVSISVARVALAEKYPLKHIYYGLMAGLFISLAGCFSLTCAGGIDPALRSLHPFLPKLLTGITFPLALALIVTYGGDLFTGNTMYMCMGMRAGAISWKQLARNWSVSFLSNFAGCLLTAVFLGYLSDLYSAEPFHSYVISVAEKKAKLGFGICFLRGVGANILVCLALHLANQARDLLGRLFAVFPPVAAFCAIGFEHCVANMFFVPLGMMYGANVSVGNFLLYSMLPSTLGNIVGGGFIVGFSTDFLFGEENTNNNSNCNASSDQPGANPSEKTMYSSDASPTSPSSAAPVHATHSLSPGSRIRRFQSEEEMNASTSRHAPPMRQESV